MVANISKMKAKQQASPACCCRAAGKSIADRKKHLRRQVLFFRGAGGRTRTGTPLLAVDFESTSSTNSNTPANKDIIQEYGANSKRKIHRSFLHFSGRLALSFSCYV